MYHYQDSTAFKVYKNVINLLVRFSMNTENLMYAVCMIQVRVVLANLIPEENFVFEESFENETCIKSHISYDQSVT